MSAMILLSVRIILFYVLLIGNLSSDLFSTLFLCVVCKKTKRIRKSCTVRYEKVVTAFSFVRFLHGASLRSRGHYSGFYLSYFFSLSCGFVHRKRQRVWKDALSGYYREFQELHLNVGRWGSFTNLSQLVLLCWYVNYKRMYIKMKFIWIYFITQ